VAFVRDRMMIVGRDVELRARLARLLKAGGYRVEIAESASHARRIGFAGIALAIVAPDGANPEERGPLQELRTEIGNVLLVAAPGAKRDPNSDLLDVTDETGLLARVAEALAPAREADTAEPTLQFAGYRLDLGGHSLLNPADREIPLTHSEFSLLRALALRAGRVLSREQLLQVLAGREAEAYDRSIDMQIVRLRRKIEPDPKHPTLIVTVPGSGYKFAAQVGHAKALVPEPETAAAPLALPPRPRLSVAVLPFLNLSQDPSLDYVADGIVDNLLTDLSQALPGSFVISRSTAFTYKGRHVPIRQIGEELQVRYVLEGSVRADMARLRVNAQLIDALTEEHLWMERFDKERCDILQVQDEIVARLSRSVGVAMVRREGTRGRSEEGEREDTVDLVMRGNAVATDLSRKERAAEAVALFKRALELDPENVDAMVGIASTRIYQILNLYKTVGRDALLAEAEALIARAMGLATDHVGVMKARAVLLRARGRFADAIIADMSVVALNPGDPAAYRELGLNNLYLGQHQEAVDWFRRADSVAPRDRVRWTWLQGLGRALIHLGKDAEAVETFRLVVHGNPHLSRDRAFLAAAEALVGNTERAKLHLAEYNELDPGMTIRRFAEERSSVPTGAVSATYLRGFERILEGLRRAGMPE
jgi:TolB-like protein/Flp pilus assembly protein TadD